MINHATTEVFIDDLEVPAENLIGEEGKGFRYILDGMNAERILIAAECIGDGRWFIEQRRRLRERARRLRPADRPEPGRPVPDRRAHARIEAADLMRWRAAALFERGEPCGAEANMAKLLASEASWEAANACLHTHGGFGFAERVRRRAQVPRDAALPGRARSRPTWSWPSWPSTCSACRAPTERVRPRPAQLGAGPWAATSALKSCRRANGRPPVAAATAMTISSGRGASGTRSSSVR